MGLNQYILINKGVALRGAGAGLTILKNPRNLAGVDTSADPVPIVIVGPGRWVNPDGDMRCQTAPTSCQAQYMQRLSADGRQGAMSVTVADGGIFKPGAFVLLDETSCASWQPDVTGLGQQVWASSDYAVQWALYNPNTAQYSLTPVTPSAANNWAGVGVGNDAACWFSRQDRPQNEIKEIASVSGNTVTFTSPLTKDYRASHYAELTTYTGGNAQVVQAGLEQLSAIGGGNGAVLFNNTAYSWARNIEVTTWLGEGVMLDGAFRTELRDSYIHDGSWPVPGGSGYAIATSHGSSELLIENNISMGANKVMVARSSGAGSVVAYNYMDHGYIGYDSAWIEAGINGSHMVGSHHMLFEGNQSFNIESDDTHGNSTRHTFFRNYLTTVRGPFTNALTGESIDDAAQAGNGPKRAAAAGTYSYWMSFVGNVLGAPGIVTAANGYVDDSADWGAHSSAIWLLGWNPVVPHTTDTQSGPNGGARRQLGHAARQADLADANQRGHAAGVGLPERQTRLLRRQPVAVGGSRDRQDLHAASQGPLRCGDAECGAVSRPTESEIAMRFLCRRFHGCAWIVAALCLAGSGQAIAAPARPSVQTGAAHSYSAEKSVARARGQIGVTVAYDAAYTVIPYPNGDVSQDKGVCTDVIIRALRGQGIDLEQLVHEDMRRAFSKYPTRWGLKRPDSNIDHRRVLNLETYLRRQRRDLPVSQDPRDYRAGDWVTWRLGDKEQLPHIGMVSDRLAPDGTPLIIHNIGNGTQEENVLFAFPMAGHFRWR